MNWLGIDIGGANLKAADGQGWAGITRFALWRNPSWLTAALKSLIDSAPAADQIAVTMTGELCDCFRTKAEGVRHIVHCLQEAATGRSVRVYLVDGRFVEADDALEKPHLAAASNWHALACFAGRFASAGTALLIDVGSTTTDIVPLVNGLPQARGLSDLDRLLASELVYTGIGRTPVCAITRWLPWRGDRCPVAAELFATAADAYVMLGDVPEQRDNLDTADGRPLTRDFAHERLARMICADRTIFTRADAESAAKAICEAQIKQIGEAVRIVALSMPRRPDCLVVIGAGEFLAHKAVMAVLPEMTAISITERLGGRVSFAAPAHAVAVLAAENV